VAFKDVDLVQTENVPSGGTFRYRSADTQAQILTPGYFDASAKRFNKYDKLEILSNINGTPVSTDIYVLSGKGVTPVQLGAQLSGSGGGAVGPNSIGEAELIDTLNPSDAGSFTNANLTVNADGRITAISNGSSGGAGGSLGPNTVGSSELIDGSIEANDLSAEVGLFADGGIRPDDFTFNASDKDLLIRSTGGSQASVNPLPGGTLITGRREAATDLTLVLGAGVTNPFNDNLVIVAGAIFSIFFVPASSDIWVRQQ